MLSHEKNPEDIIKYIGIIKNIEWTAPVTTKCLGKFFGNLRPYTISFVNNFVCLIAILSTKKMLAIWAQKI